jgi:hypothetical protein
MEIYNDWLVSKMTRTELTELCDDDKKERKRLQKIKSNKKYREENPEKLKEANKKYREENPEKVKEYYEKYQQSPNGKKVNTLGNWTNRGLEESKEDLDRIYELYLTQELCNACDIQLTRNGDNSSTQACMDHDHITNRFRHIICKSCNTQDKWMQYFC